MTKRELARWVAWFAKLTGRSIPEALDYLERRGEGAAEERRCFISCDYRQAPALRAWIAFELEANGLRVIQS